MNTQNSIYTKLAKLQEVKLALQNNARQIHLSIADDLDKTANEAYTSMQKLRDIESKISDVVEVYQSIRDKADQLSQEFNESMDKAEQLLAKLENSMSKFEDAADSLGVNPSDSEPYNFAEEAIGDLEGALDEAQTGFDKLQQYFPQ